MSLKIGFTTQDQYLGSQSKRYSENLYKGKLTYNKNLLDD